MGVLTEEEQRKRDQDETLCRGYILSTLTDRLYDLYTPMTSAREIWNSLEEKYTAEKEGAYKFITFKFFEFLMEDNVYILDQVHEFIILVSKFKNLDIEIPEKLLVRAIITKLPSSWHNYRKKLMHTSEDFTLDQIQKHLRIEEETRIHKKNLSGASSSKVNYVVSGRTTKEMTRRGRELHMASVTIIIDDWWYDSGATTHVCNNRDLFKTYKETKDGHEVMMGDNHTSKVIGSGNMEIQFTSGKKLTLMNVLHVPNIRKNLVSGFKLCKSGFKDVIESDKVIMSKANVFVGKAYACDGMFKLNINKITSFAYFPDCNFISSFDIECSTFNLWYNCLGHINYRTMKDMLKQGIISYNGEYKDKCEISVQVKMKRKPFPKVDRQSKILELVHSDICELNGQLTRGGNRGLKSVFVGYAKDSKSYRCLDLDSNVIVESRDVDFFENKFCHDSTSTNEIMTQIPQDISGPDLNSNNKRNMAESSSAPRRSERARKERSLDPDFIDSQAIIFLVEGDNENNVVNKIPVLLNVEDAPKTYTEAITSRNFRFWKELIDDEMDSIIKYMNEVDTILGIKIKRHSEGYALNQFHYIDKIIDKFQHLNIEEANTPYESSCKLVENNGRVIA
ncbi:zinc finger, CCHC-type containing protein [Tanacetum coccineum]